MGRQMINVKCTCHDEDKPDLNKAYKLCEAIIERKAYKWASKKIKRRLDLLNKDVIKLSQFCVKANHIINHDTEYIKTF